MITETDKFSSVSVLAKTVLNRTDQSPNGIIEEKGGVFGDLTECEAVKNWTEENLKEFEEVGNRFITEALHWHDGTANSIKVVYTGKLRTTM
ncbi:unnamed protein product [Rhizophagus irregularis]|nr:unnamed protein product [Rhizophagus irregularis]